MLRFETINVARDWTTCRAFARDAFMESFGNLDHMPSSEDIERLWLEGLIEKDPLLCVHAWLGETIVGELRATYNERPRHGHIYLLYVTPEHRGNRATNIATELHNYAITRFQTLGATHATLNVSPTNLRANAFYNKHLWKNLGPNSEAPHVNLRELRFAKP